MEVVSAPIPASGTGISWSVIKPQYLIQRSVDDARASEVTPVVPTPVEVESAKVEEASVPVDKAADKRKRVRGQNKARGGDDLGYKAGLSSSDGHKTQFCRFIAKSGVCRFGDKCRDEHDLASYLAHKPADLPKAPYLPSVFERRDTSAAETHVSVETPSMVTQAWPDGEDVGCYVWHVRGSCPSGVSCRWGSGHTAADGSQRKLHDATPESAAASKALPAHMMYQEEVNFLPNGMVPQLHKSRYTFISGVEKQAEGTVAGEGIDGADKWKGWVYRDARIRSAEKRKIDFTNKVYIAPLTTVGNLPFRRICVGFGADITCGEMAMAQNLENGSMPEWALLRRHPSERCFGVQIAGGQPEIMTRTAELIERHMDVDFVDINMGCPLDAVCNKGMGAGLMGKPGRLRDLLRGMRNILTAPLTIKMRSGLTDKADARFAHEMVQKLRIWSVSREDGEDVVFPIVDAATIHSRTRQQRYSRYADWDYTRTVVQAAVSPQVKYSVSQCLREGYTIEELMERKRPGVLEVRQTEDIVFFDGSYLPSIPVIGNGDILHWKEFYNRAEETGTVTQLIGRGALIKPWIAQEIKEQCDIDIRSSQRLEMLQQFVHYGLEHWGSDQNGVNHTRRFLLEWLSFLHRYVPVGLLEVLPQRMNDRPPPFVGRDDLETLMASPKAQDWIKISEMLLGPVPDDFSFVPKHKASNYSTTDGASRNAEAGGPSAKRARYDDDAEAEG